MAGAGESLDMSIRIEVNGEARELDRDASVGALLDALGYDQRGLAVAVGDEVVPRREWPEWRLDDGDRVEILTIAQGGWAGCPERP
jgi:sulfur carrier protein